MGTPRAVRRRSRFHSRSRSADAADIRQSSGQSVECPSLDDAMAGDRPRLMRLRNRDTPEACKRRLHCTVPTGSVLVPPWDGRVDSSPTLGAFPRPRIWCRLVRLIRGLAVRTGFPVDFGGCRNRSCFFSSFSSRSTLSSSSEIRANSVPRSCSHCKRIPSKNAANGGSHLPFQLRR